MKCFEAISLSANQLGIAVSPWILDGYEMFFLVHSNTSCLKVCVL